MKTKLLRKIRKEYEILYYPEGDKTQGSIRKNEPHFVVNQKIRLISGCFTHQVGRTTRRKNAYEMLIKAIRQKYGANEKGKFKRLW